MASRRSPEGARSTTVTFRVNESEYAQLVAKAEAANLSLSDYLRSVLSDPLPPETVAAYANLSNNLSAVEEAVHLAQTLLSGGKGA